MLFVLLQTNWGILNLLEVDLTHSDENVRCQRCFEAKFSLFSIQCYQSFLF